MIETGLPFEKRRMNRYDYTYFYYFNDYGFWKTADLVDQGGMGNYKDIIHSRLFANCLDCIGIIRRHIHCNCIAYHRRYCHISEVGNGVEHYEI